MKDRKLCSGRDLARMPNPICWKCKHFHKNAACKAFPKGIPADILCSKTDHHQPYPGDHGIRFEPVEASHPLATMTKLANSP
jgi:hypothetical protein